MNNDNLEKMLEEMSHEDFEILGKEMEEFPTLIEDNLIRNFELVLKYEESQTEEALQEYTDDFASTIVFFKKNTPMTFKMMVQNADKKDLEYWSMAVSGELESLKTSLKKSSDDARDIYELKAKIMGDDVSYLEVLKKAFSEIKEKINA